MTNSLPARPRRVPDLVERLAAWSWRLIVIGIVVLACLWLLRPARVVFFPIVVALFRSRALSPVSSMLRRHRWRPGLAAGVSLVGFFVVLVGVMTLVVGAIADETESLEPTLTQAIDDIEEWLVND